MSFSMPASAAAPLRQAGVAFKNARIQTAKVGAEMNAATTTPRPSTTRPRASTASRARATTRRKYLGYTRASRHARFFLALSSPLAAARSNQYGRARGQRRPGFRAPNHDREALPSHRWALPPPGARYRILEQKPCPIQAKVCSSIAVRLHRQSYTSPFGGHLRLLYASSTSRHGRNSKFLRHTTGIHR